ncbi:hypothetical protein [Streptomyces sp. NPDC057238]|uniref:hypothetical protein n=1 Tax=Streptomyces sp. NPDC057238 TaxID=3346060 RepID=UPI00363A2D43
MAPSSDTFRDFIGDVADDAKKALDDILDRPVSRRSSSDTSPLMQNLRLQAAANLPVETLQALGKLAVLESITGTTRGSRSRDRDDDIVGLGSLALLGGVNPLAGFAGLAVPATTAGVAGAAVQAPGTASSAAGASGGLTENLAALPDQINRLQETVATLARTLEGIQNLGATGGRGAGGGGGRDKS